MEKEVSGTSNFRRYVVLDVETTGLSPKYGDRVIEIGAVVIEDKRITGEFHSLVNAGRPIPKMVQRIHDITDEMLEGEPMSEEVMPVFCEFIKDSILIAHNARFDIGFMKSEFARLDLDLDHEYICTLQASRKLYPDIPNHKLEAVYRHLFGEVSKDARLHRALDDARLTAQIWLEMSEKLY